MLYMSSSIDFVHTESAVCIIYGECIGGAVALLNIVRAKKKSSLTLMTEIIVFLRFSVATIKLANEFNPALGVVFI